MSWQRVRIEFEALLDRPAAERQRRLEELAGTDRWLADQLRELLARDATGAAFLERAEPVAPVAPAAAAGMQFGRYRLLRPLGSGGMGSVWEAEQQEPRRRVALKLLADAGLAPEQRWRFRHEVQVLARLNHPSIATFFEAGTETLAGREVAWLAMELVDGASDVLAWAKAHGLSRAARLGLFRRLCEAVAHGHRLGVLHRDLKPSNVLVGSDGQLKLIDFGVARALGDTGDATMLTRPGEVVGTLQFMAPEQLRGQPTAIGAPCDVWALGVLLYHLLCEQAPFDFTGRSLPEIARLLLETEPVPPRRACPDLPVDLASIVLKTLEKEPARRYPTVDALVADLERFDAHLPVLARPAHAAYRCRKFVRRHRVGLAVVAAVVAGLAVGGVGLWRGVLEAREGERLAVVGREEAKKGEQLALQGRAEAQKGERAALRASEFSREVLRVTVALFDGIDETEGSRDLTVHELLDAAVLDERATSDPGIEQVVRQVRGNAYSRLDRWQEARREYERALALREGALQAVAGTVDEAATVARAHLIEAHLGRALARTGERERGDAMLRDAVEAAAQLDDASRIKILQQFCRHLADENADAELLEQGRALRAVGERVGGAYECIDADGWIARAAGALQQHDVAKPAAERAWAGARALFGDDHKHTVNALATYVTVVQEAGDLDTAERLYPELVERVAKVFGASHPNLLTTLNNRAHLLMTRGRRDEALGVLREVVAAHEARGGPLTNEHLQARHNLGMLLNQAAKYAEAEPLLRQAAEGSRVVLGPDNPEGMMMRFNHGACLAWSKRFAEAEPILLAEYAGLAARLPAGHGVLAKSRRTIVDAYRTNGRAEEAARWQAK